MAYPFDDSDPFAQPDAPQHFPPPPYGQIPGQPLPLFPYGYPTMVGGLNANPSIVGATAGTGTGQGTDDPGSTSSASADAPPMHHLHDFGLPDEPAEGPLAEVAEALSSWYGAGGGVPSFEPHHQHQQPQHSQHSQHQQHQQQHSQQQQHQPQQHQQQHHQQTQHSHDPNQGQNHGQNHNFGGWVPSPDQHHQQHPHQQQRQTPAPPPPPPLLQPHTEEPPKDGPDPDADPLAYLNGLTKSDYASFAHPSDGGDTLSGAAAWRLTVDPFPFSNGFEGAGGLQIQTVQQNMRPDVLAKHAKDVEEVSAAAAMAKSWRGPWRGHGLKRSLGKRVGVLGRGYYGAKLRRSTLECDMKRGATLVRRS